MDNTNQRFEQPSPGVFVIHQPDFIDSQFNTITFEGAIDFSVFQKTGAYIRQV